MNFEFNLSLVLGHSILYESICRQTFHGIRYEAFNGPGSSPGVGDTTAQQLQAYTQNLPALLQATAAQAPGTAQQYQQAISETAPEQQALQNQLLAQYGSGLYSTGNSLNALNSQGGLNTATSNIQGAGGNLAQLEQSLQQQLNPNYYKEQGATANQLSNLLGSVNVTGNGLTGSEEAQVRRSNAQQDAQRGIGNAPSQTATVANAMNFGTALQQKAQTLSGIIGQATSFLNSAQPSSNPINAGNVGTGASTTMNNPGATAFLGAGAPAGASAANAANTSLAGGLLGNVNSSSNNAANNTQANQSLGAASTIMGSLPNISM